MTKFLKILTLSALVIFGGYGLYGAEIGDLNTTDASNTARFPEGMAPSAVNDAARSLEGILARGLRDTVDGYVLTAGTSSAFTVSANRTLSAYYDGLTQTVEWHTTPNTTATVNIDSVGAKNLVWPNGSTITTGELISGARAVLQYDSAGSGTFQILSVPSAPGPSTSGGVTDQIPKYSSSSAFTTSGITATSVQLVGKKTIWVPAGAMVARTTSGGSISKSELSTNKVMLNTMAFGGSAISYAQFNIAAPKSWNESTVTAKFDWTAITGSGTAQWYLHCLAVSDDDAMDAAFGTAQGITDTLITANDAHLTSETAAITCSGTPAENDLLFFQVYRDGTADSHAADAYLLGVRVFMTTTGQTDE